ncbi:MAG: dihydrofolate reductase [Bacteroidia bacterium]
MISLIVATGKNLAIGKDNQLLWHLPADLSYFKNLTVGKPIIMGRKTYESIGRPLPNRRNIIVSRNKELEIEGCDVYTSIDEAFASCANEAEIMVIGGEEIYNQSIAKAQRIYRTLVESSPEADKFFPEIEQEIWHQQLSLRHPADEKNEFTMTFEMWERKIPL